MSKTILAILDTHEKSSDFVKSVVGSALALNAHLIFEILTTPPLMVDRLAPYGSIYTFPGELAAASREHEQAIRSTLPSGLSFEFFSRTDDVAFMPTELRKSPLPADLIMIGSKASWTLEWLRRRTIETLLLTSGSPIVLLPPERDLAPVKRVALGWQPGAASMRAAQGLMALAAPAAKIHVVHVAGGFLDDPDEGLRQISAYLSRHGFDVSSEVSDSRDSIADVLGQYALEFRADLLAVGGYGHSRAREIVLGGATRALIEGCETPVLLSH